MGKESTYSLTSSSNRSPPLRQPPLQGLGRNRGAIKADRCPWSVSFFDHRQMHFYAFHFWQAIFLVFPLQFRLE